MKVIIIFEKIKDRLFVAKFDTSNRDELDNAFTFWRDAEYLREFFLKYRLDLKVLDPVMKVYQAVDSVLGEAEDIHDALFEAAIHDRLDELFKPLDNREQDQTRYELQKFKATGPKRKSMLRLYAIKFLDTYVISGHAVKITNKMERPHLRAELHKLELLKQYLKTDGIESTFVYLDIDV